MLRDLPTGVGIRRATANDSATLAALRWEWRLERYLDAVETFDEFAAAFESWWAPRRASHHAFVVVDGDDVVGMAFLALVDRVPDPGNHSRIHADLQSVYLQPPYRGRGIGTELVRHLVHAARTAGCDKVTVHSGHRALPLYVRESFVAHDRLLELDLRTE